ncbi:hemoglobin/transferrin/lactoferrin receptor protein [Pseudomonas hunanensis]|uniref:Hemoglobin/transferrin/lactoferrin receptor protein n=1 Tax=Pseudomonas hunanensis TaxID=1247546 RepID=A0ACC6K0U9_9PSED|nr:TonB-dependent receptor [Pseudomonas hunanensis]MDR6712057.1 hemoglobin/transferrin/lactoferrin receptor protein [Pseudomonas hunanensis]
MSLLTTPPSPMRLKPLAWSILLALSSPAALAEGEPQAGKTSTPNMGAIEIELPAGFEDELNKSGTSQKGLQVLEASEVKGEWEALDEKGKNDVYRKDVSNVYVGKEDIERYKGASVGDLFKGLNGVYSGESRNSGALDPNIRGIQGEGRIPVTVDGTEQSTSVWLGSAGVSNRNYVDPNMIGGISVEKGPSMTPGVKSGIGGSVEIRTLDAEDIVTPGERYGLEIKSETASNAVAPNEDGINNLGRDYRDIEGAYRAGQYIYFANGGGTLYTPHESSRSNDFDFEDNAFRIAAATRQENFDLLGAYSYRKKGNYYSGKEGSKRYESESGYDGEAAQNTQAIGDTTGNYLASFYNPGGEVSGTSNEMRTTLLKGTVYLPYEQRVKVSYMHSDIEFGETMPYLINETMHQVPSGSNFGFQLPYSEVNQDTLSINYTWNPEDNRWVDLDAGFWMTKSDSKRYQNGEQVYAIAGDGDAAWDNYVQCRYSLSGCNGNTAMPDKLANSDGRFNLFSRALQVTQHDRWGVTLGNRMQLTDSWMLTLSGDFSKEKLEQSDNASKDIGSNYIFALNYLGPRGGRREQYNFSFNNEWAATPWLTFTAGARYSDYNSFDTTLDDYRKAQTAGWDVSAYQTAENFGYKRLLSDQEALDFEKTVRAEVESWGVDDPDFIEENVAATLGDASVNGVYYVQADDVQVPLKGTVLDSSANPFTNGTIDLNEQVVNAQGSGRTVARYLPTWAGTSSPYQQIPESERWAKPKKREDSAWAPMAGVTVKLSDSARVYARYVEFIRFPTIYEDSQSYSGTGMGVTANQPSPEHAYNWEVGYVQDLLGFAPGWRSADLRVNYYKSEIKDYIDRDFSYNIIQYEKKLMSGIELQARFDTGKYFTNFGASYRLDQRLCDKDVANTLDPIYGRVKECVTGGFPSTFSRTSLQPKYSLNLDGGVRLFDERLELGARMVYHSSAQNKEEAKWIEQNLNFVKGINQPYEWHPIWVFDSYATLHVNKHIDVDVGVNNITNRYYLDPLSRTVMPAPGRTLKVGLTARF